MAIRMPTILQKSSDDKSTQQALHIPGIIDGSQQGPDLELMMATYKKDLPLPLKKHLEDKLLLQLKMCQDKGRFPEEVFDMFATTLCGRYAGTMATLLLSCSF